MPRTLAPQSIELFLFDIDGVFLAGKEDARLLSGGRALAALRARQTRLVGLTVLAWALALAGLGTWLTRRARRP